MNIVKANYAIFVTLLILSALPKMLELSLFVIGIIAFSNTAGVLVVGYETTRKRDQTLPLPVVEHLNDQMAMLMLFVCAGLVATFQVVVQFLGYGVGWVKALTGLNWALYGGGVLWIAAGVRRAWWPKTS
jgi:hypothetical protein